MQSGSISLLFVRLSLLPHALGYIRRDLAKSNIAVAQLEGEYTIDLDSQEVLFIDRSSDFEEIFRCLRHSGKRLTQNKDATFIACCAPDQALIGSQDAAFDCCEINHRLTGSNSTGYTCCPLDQIYKGSCYRDTDQNCSQGTILAGGECVYPSGTIEDVDGFHRLTSPPPECESDVREGKCYILQTKDDHWLGHNKEGHYDIADISHAHTFGKFRFCKTEACDGTSSINPNDEFRIHDIHKHTNRGMSGRQWLDRSTNGAPYRITPTWDEAQRFSITRWTDGKYCMAAVCDAFDNQVCLPLELIKVPCDIHAPENSCLWSKSSDTSDDFRHQVVSENSEAEKPVMQSDSQYRLISWQIRMHSFTFIVLGLSDLLIVLILFKRLPPL